MINITPEFDDYLLKASGNFQLYRRLLALIRTTAQQNAERIFVVVLNDADEADPVLTIYLGARHPDRDAWSIQHGAPSDDDFLWNINEVYSRLDLTKLGTAGRYQSATYILQADFGNTRFIHEKGSTCP